jgi:excinuclease ABC subunit A
LELTGASGRNLRQLDLRIPLGCLTVVVGPSGSGKSTLILDTMCPAIISDKSKESSMALPFRSLAGTDHIQGCVAIDQSPIQRSTRSCPATYTKAMQDIRSIFSESLDAKARRFGVGQFSFNSEMGRCSTCEGLGYTLVDMQFMADLRLPCLECDGKRFRPEVLEVRFRDQNIAEVLDLTIAKAHDFFRGYSSLQDKLKPILELGLGYLPLGQSLNELSAGESMRLKLAKHLKDRCSDSPQGDLIVMDEPTTGLHFSDVDRLILALDRLIDHGNSVLLIEHNEQMIRCADHIIELGPGPGPEGGQIIAQGTVRDVLQNENSVTARYLKI